MSTAMLAHLEEQMRMNYIQILPGDKSRWS